MITTARQLKKELEKIDDDFVTVMIEDREYMIECISHVANYAEFPSAHLCLKCKDCGDGYIKR